MLSHIIKFPPYLQHAVINKAAYLAPNDTNLFAWKANTIKMTSM